MKRVIVVVIDSMGIGALPDAPQFGDSMECDTFGNVYRHNNGLKIPNLISLGIGNIESVDCAAAAEIPIASYGRLMEVSHGKDTTTGHWELAGLILDEPFGVFPDGFPAELMDRFVQVTGCGGFLGNCPASGTAIIEEHNAEHVKTGYPIVYTSADSVFQIACNTAIVSLETLYRWCQQAREILDDGYNVSRVIARPYHEVDGKLKRLSGARRDLAVPPHKPTILNHILKSGGHVLGIGKIVDIYLSSGVSHAVHTSGNTEGLKLTLDAIKGELDFSKIKTDQNFSSEPNSQFIFTNLVDTDALYGHRNNPEGYGQAIEEIDAALPSMIKALGEEDLLIITADHGCDPTAPGTDHTREYVPLLAYSRASEPKGFGTQPSFTFMADMIAEWLEIESWKPQMANTPINANLHKK